MQGAEKSLKTPKNRTATSLKSRNLRFLKTPSLRAYGRDSALGKKKQRKMLACPRLNDRHACATRATKRNMHVFQHFVMDSVPALRLAVLHFTLHCKNEESKRKDFLNP